MDCVELLVPRECCSTPVLLLCASFQLVDHDFSLSKKMAATLIFHYKSNASCVLAWGPIQNSPHQPTSEWLSEDYSITPPLQHTSHVTWKCSASQELQISSPPLSTSKSLTKDAVCVCRWERTWTGMDQREHIETQWILGCGMLQTTPKARCLQEVLGSNMGLVAGQGIALSSSARGSPSIHTDRYIYIYTQIHIKKNNCFTALTCITSITASYALCQKTHPILSHIFARDFSECQIRPWGCPVHSTVHAPTFPSVHLKGGHWCVSIMQPLPAWYRDRSIKGNTTARFRGFQNWGQTQ